MPIAREGDFLVSRTMGNTPHIGIESGNLKQCVDEAQASAYKGVFGSPTFGFRERDLDFLRQLSKLEEIWFWDVDLANIDAVHELHQLRSFGVHPKRPAIDFSRFSALVNLVVTPVPGDQGIANLETLRSLSVWHFNPRARTFEGLALPAGLERLELNWANPATLAGLAGGASVRHLEIHRCRNLESLAELPSLFPRLEHLVVSGCGKIEPQDKASWLPFQPELRHVSIQGRKLV